MSVTQLPLAAPPHRNQQLFSDHYLNEILPTQTAWKSLALEAAPIKQALSAILKGFTPSENEAQLEEDVVRPILRELGHTFEVQPALTTPDGTKKPDYILYRSAADQTNNRGKVLNEDLLRNTAFAVADAKYWNRPLDIALAVKGKSGDPFNNRNPSYQIAFYVQQSGLPWGILTNGRLWRLYHRDTAHKLDRFYEVDLPTLLESSDPNAFLYFLAFFRRAAFEPGPLGVAEMLQASVDYALRVGNSLKLQVFESLRHIAQGFLDDPRNNLQPDPTTLKAIYDNSLILLYRLLFVFYAEARELLPVRESTMYRDQYSLRALTHDIADDLNRGRALLPTGTRIWQRLLELFDSIDKGNPPLKVATFNGGLFDPEQHPFLAQYSVGDAHLQQALDTIARVDGQFVDYRDLAEQHLGTIYEGLLEYHLQELSPPEDGWRVALLNDRGERKKIGSYFTPNYIVKYIVDHTLGPVLDAAVAGKDDDAKIDAVLNVNVLDPAMGSGYFLVEATEYIARYLVDLALARPGDADADESDLAYWKRRVVQSCIYGVDLNPLAVDLAKLSLWLSTVARDRPLSFLDHHLRTGNSLVGARLSDVQSRSRASDTKAKTAKTKGANKIAKKVAVGQIAMFDDDAFRRNISTAVGSMWLIEETKGTTVAEVKEQERIYRNLHDVLIKRYGRLADLITAADFGLDIDPTLWPILADSVLGQAPLRPPKFDIWLAEADRLSTQERFFHWELEFPEVFFDRHGRPLREDAGFDAVVGNPPYVRQEKLASTKRYFASSYEPVYASAADLFVYFFAQGFHLLHAQGVLSYISSNSWLRSNYAEPLRRFLRTETNVREIVDLGDNRVFSSAPDVYPAILTVGRETPRPPHTAQVATFARHEGVSDFENQVSRKLKTLAIHDQEDSGWQLGSDALRALVRRLRSNADVLENVVSGKMYYGIKTGLNEAFVVGRHEHEVLRSTSSFSASLIKPFVRGEDLRPWYREDEGYGLIVIPSGWTKNRYGGDLDEDGAWYFLNEDFPEIANRLAAYREKARARSDQGDYWWELRSCDYYSELDGPKILYPDIAKRPRVSWDESGSYPGNTAYAIATQELSILGYLSSRCAWFLISQTAQSLGERAGLNRYRMIDQYMRPLPVPAIPDTDKDLLTELSRELTKSSFDRYQLGQKSQSRILTDFGSLTSRLNQKLTSWWTLDFPAFRAELKKALKTDIPVKERDDWEDWLTTQRAEHDRLTADIIRLETDLNTIVYQLFDLTPAEIQLIEETTKYPYGEV